MWLRGIVYMVALYRETFVLETMNMNNVGMIVRIHNKMVLKVDLNPPAN